MDDFLTDSLDNLHKIGGATSSCFVKALPVSLHFKVSPVIGLLQVGGLFCSSGFRWLSGSLEGRVSPTLVGPNYFIEIVKSICEKVVHAPYMYQSSM